MYAVPINFFALQEVIEAEVFQMPLLLKSIIRLDLKTHSEPPTIPLICISRLVWVISQPN